MDQHLKQRLNHYQTLGLKPGARSEEIERAFARLLSPLAPLPFGSIAAVSVAYETLRDPDRRRAYDQSIGIAPPQPPTRFMVPVSGTVNFIGSRYTASRSVERVQPSKPTPPKAAPRPIAPEAAEPRPVETEPPPRAEADSVSHFLAQARRLSSREPVAEPPATRAPAAVTFEPSAAESDANSLKPLVLGAIAMVGTAALFGAWLGSVSIEDVEELPTRSAAVTAKLPLADSAAAATVPAPPPRLAQQSVAVVEPTRRFKAPARRAAPAVREEAVSTPEPVTADLVAAPSVQAAEPVPAVAARLPLADATVARTIRRIGYPCESVASTAAGASAGVFVVTCTSGHSYRASPINGRYRFKRL